MKRFRFNIANLITIIFILGVGFAALRESSDLWASGVFTLTIGVLLISILLGVQRTESRRAFWIGFALFGWTYLGLSLVPSIVSRLITTKALGYLRSRLSERSLKINTVQHTGSWSLAPPGNDGIVVSHEVWLFDRTSGRRLNGWNGTTKNFVRIGHSLFALLLGMLCGQVSRRLCQSSGSPDSSTAIEA
jgi:hypothetical protein